MALLAGIGSIINAVQIKKIKKNIKILQAQNILQDQKIDELARYMNVTAAQICIHNNQIYDLHVQAVRLEEGLQEMMDMTNFHIYTTYQVNTAQASIFRLQIGLNAIETNIDKIFEYLRVMTTQKITSMVIPAVALRRLLCTIRERMRPNPRLRLPYNPDNREIWGYY